MPGWYSSNQSTCQTNSEPSMGWMLNSTSALLFHSSSSTSTWCLTAASESSTASAPWGSPGLLLVSSSSRFSSSSGSGGECKSSTPYLRHLRVIGKKQTNRQTTSKPDAQPNSTKLRVNVGLLLNFSRYLLGSTLSVAPGCLGAAAERLPSPERSEALCCWASGRWKDPRVPRHPQHLGRRWRAAEECLS